MPPRQQPAQCDRVTAAVGQLAFRVDATVTVTTNLKGRGRAGARPTERHLGTVAAMRARMLMSAAATGASHSGWQKAGFNEPASPRRSVMCSHAGENVTLAVCTAAH